MATLQSTRAGTAAPAERTGWAPLTVVLAGTFVTYLDFFIVNVALPSIDAELHAGPAALQFVVAGFALTFAVGMISVAGSVTSTAGAGSSAWVSPCSP